MRRCLPCKLKIITESVAAGAIFKAYIEFGFFALHGLILKT